MSDQDEHELGLDSHEATRSGRHIKRKRFDDEIVESSLGTTMKTAVTPTTVAVAMTPLKIEEPPTPVNHGPSFSEHVEQLTSLDGSDDDMDEWKPSDDYVLLQATLQLLDLNLVYKCSKFSYPFSLEEISERWKYILRGTSLHSNFGKLHPTTLEYLQKSIPFSSSEESILAKISPHETCILSKFQNILEQNSDAFLATRTAKGLMKHWQLMKQRYLLNEQNVPSSSENDVMMSLSDFEETLVSPNGQNSTSTNLQQRNRQDFDLDYELRQLQRASKKEMKRLESELPFWQTLSDSISGHHVADFDDQTLAVLRGRLVRYLMRSKEISLGRASNEVTVDIDFSLEGPAFKISRRQAIIKLRNNGEFVFANEGKRTVYIDGSPVLTGNKSRLNHNSILELAGLRFVFLVNQKLTASGLLDQIL